MEAENEGWAAIYCILLVGYFPWPASLYTITQPGRLKDIMNSMLAFCDETGLLPVWDLSTYETNCMSGYHAVPVLADAVLKNTPGVDPERAYEAMKKSAFQQGRGVQPYCKYGYVPPGAIVVQCYQDAGIFI